MAPNSSSPMTKREHDTRLLGEVQGSSREPSHTAGVKLELVDLLARVEAAEGADRELDAAIYCAFPRAYEANPHPARRPGFVTVHYPAQRTHSTFAVQRFTASLDDVLALVGRALPGWLWEVTTLTTSTGGKRQPQAFVVASDHPPGQEITSFGVASAPALSILAALLKALIAKDAQS